MASITRSWLPSSEGSDRIALSAQVDLRSDLLATTTSQLITRVDFVPFSTRDIDAACAFYGTTLGLPRSVYVPDRNYAEFETGNVTISIVDGERMGIGHAVNTIALALHVDDMAAALPI